MSPLGLIDSIDKVSPTSLLINSLIFFSLIKYSSSLSLYTAVIYLSNCEIAIARFFEG